jgi:hypothetical protein
VTLFFRKSAKSKDALRDPENDLSSRLEKVERALHEALGAIESLEADLDWQGGQIKKLRGTVTGGRRNHVHDEGNGRPDLQEPARFSPEWFQRERERLGIPINPGR